MKEYFIHARCVNTLGYTQASPPPPRQEQPVASAEQTSRWRRGGREGRPFPKGAGSVPAFIRHSRDSHARDAPFLLPLKVKFPPQCPPLCLVKGGRGEAAGKGVRAGGEGWLLRREKKEEQEEEEGRRGEGGKAIDGEMQQPAGRRAATGDAEGRRTQRVREAWRARAWQRRGRRRGRGDFGEKWLRFCLALRGKK